MQTFEFSSRRSPIYAQGGLVGASQPLAVAAGLELLRKGGNAADAAIAAAAALNVCEPFSTGLGGDCFALFYSAQTGRISAMNGSGRSPEALSLERIHSEGFNAGLPPRHPYTITVPGACAGWGDLIERHGKLSLREVLQPAIQLAKEGFPVAPLTADIWADLVQKALRPEHGGQELTIEGRAPQAGEIFRNPGLADVLTRIAQGGKQAFYTGELARRIVQAVRSAGGCLSESDLAAHQTTWEMPIRTSYRGVNIWECPPNGQGLAVLLALNLLEGFDLPDLPPLSPQRLHLQIEAMRLAFADAHAFIADPAFSPIPLEGLLSKDYANHRRLLIDPKQASLQHTHGAPHTASDTVYLSVVDAQGNACSFINSLFMEFGTGIIPAGCGFALQNRGYNFSLDPGSPNVLAPGKRPYHTIIPAMATLPASNPLSEEAKAEQLFACFGVMGKFMQPQGHIQVVCALIDDRLDPQSTLDRPRFCILDGQSGGAVALEEGLPLQAMSRLAEMGHPVIPVSGSQRAMFGRGQIILRDSHRGVLCGGSDPRADGCVMTL